MTLQEQLELWEKKSDATDEMDTITDDLNDGVINPEVNPTVKTPALQRIMIIENDRDAYVADRIARIEAAIVEEAARDAEQAALLAELNA